MIILSADTTSTGCSVAVLEDGNVLSELHVKKYETHSKHLLKLIDTALGTAGKDISDIDVFGTGSGPGSFTGLRIGISTLKGLADATEKPLRGVSSLEALALGVQFCETTVCTILDARKKEVYASFFKFREKSLVRLTDDVAISPEELVNKIETPTLFIGNGVDVYKTFLAESLVEKAVFVSEDLNYINAVNIGKLVYEDMINNAGDQLYELLPNYIRKSDAEMNLKR